MTGHIWDPLIDWTLVSDVNWLADSIRWAVFIMAIVQAALLANLYLRHQVGRMNGQAAWGATLTYLAIAYAQPRRIIFEDDLIPLTLLVVVALVLSLVGTFKVMRINLFRGRREQDR